MGKNPSYDKNGLKKGPWTADEDEKLIDYIRKHGDGRWKTVPKIAGLQRCGKSCRLRWTNYLRPDIKRGRFTFEEEEIIIQLHSILGNKWSAIAARLPGRTDNEIKNYWNTHIRKRLLRMGIDPVTHSPRLDLLQLYSLLNSCIGNSSVTQPNFQNLSGILPPPQIMMNPNLINILTCLFSSHHKLLQSWPQNLHPHHQNHFQQTLNPSVLDHYPDDELMQTSFREGEGASQRSPPLPSLFQQFSDVERGLVSTSDRDITHGSSDQSFIEIFAGSQDFPSMNNNTNNISPDFGFESAMTSMPSSKSTPLHSSTTTFVSSITEDERDSYCSMLEIPKTMDMFSLDRLA